MLVLSILLLGWATLRASLWESPFAAREAAARVAETLRGLRGAPDRRQEVLPDETPPVAAAQWRTKSADDLWLMANIRVGLAEGGIPFAQGDGPLTSEASSDPSALVRQSGASTLTVASPDGASDAVAPTLITPMPVATLPGDDAAGSRWSADAWLLVREDSASVILADRPSYGRSQAGSVVRYRLSSASPFRPQAYLRASAALAGAAEQEIAAGVSARVLPKVPLRLAAEVRVSETELATRVRPAAFAVTELAPVALPLGVRAEVYLQGGYVGGAYATAFVDGQIRAERRVVGIGKTELSAGGGIWGGAQRDAARVDVGPSAAVTFPLARGRGRVSADYRFRVGGDAAPSSGPALTLSAGF